MFRLDEICRDLLQRGDWRAERRSILSDIAEIPMVLLGAVLLFTSGFVGGSILKKLIGAFLLFVVVSLIVILLF